LLIEDEEHARLRKANIYARVLSVENSFDAYRSGISSARVKEGYLKSDG